MMSFLRGLVWCLGAVAVVAVAMFLTGNFELADRLTGLFLQVQPWLPMTFGVDQFLVLLTVIGLVIVALVVGGCALLLIVMGGRLSVASQRAAGQTNAAKREISHVREQHARQYEQLLSLGQVLAKRLDKRVLAQTIVEGASRVTSVGQASSVVSLWLLNFETDTIRFELGRYCDETLFVQTEFRPTEPPFAQLLVTKKATVLPKWNEGLGLIKAEKAAQLGAATGILLVPLVIEDSVLGLLAVFCHPDIVKSYEEQKPFYDAMWGELTLALAIAVQGEVAILDRLTGVHNREYFMKRLIQEIERASRFQLPLSLLMIDIDNFKQVNDSLGHPQGDAVLKIMAKLIKKEVRAVDLVGRYGGEEFIVMLPETGYGEEATSSAGAIAVAERIRKAVDDEFRGLAKPLNLTISVGVVVRRFPEDRQMDHRELLRVTDEQLYRAKATGKNRVCTLMPEKAQELS